MNIKNLILTCIGSLLFYGVDFAAAQDYKIRFNSRDLITKLKNRNNITVECHLPISNDKFQPVISLSGKFIYPEINGTHVVLGDPNDFRSSKPFFSVSCDRSRLLINSKALPDDVHSSQVTVNCEPKSARTNQRLRVRSMLKDGLFGIFNPNVRLQETTFFVSNLSEITCSEEQIPKAMISRDRNSFLSWCPTTKCTSCIRIGYLDDAIPAVVNFIAIDASKMRPFLATAFIPPAIGYRQVNNESWTMKKGPLFEKLTEVDMEEIYQKDYQRKAFFNIFQDQNSVDAYIPENGNSYLTSAKLFTERDFFYAYQQSSIFVYENTIPVWNSVATGNWELAGEFLRKLIAKEVEDVRVFSGTYGTLSLPDQQKKLQKLFLARGADGEPLIPVPKFLFKYASLNLSNISDGQLFNGIILVTVNNPYLMKDELDKDVNLKPSCSPKVICQQVLEFEDLTKGYTYCCSVSEFESTAKQLNIRPYGMGSFWTMY